MEATPFPKMHIAIVPGIESVLRDDAEARFDVALWKASDGCEMADKGPCEKDDIYFGDSDFNAPIFCPKHWELLHDPVTGQSRIVSLWD